MKGDAILFIIFYFFFLIGAMIGGIITYYLFGYDRYFLITMILTPIVGIWLVSEIIKWMKVKQK